MTTQQVRSASSHRVEHVEHVEDPVVLPSSFYTRYGKRAFDVVTSLVALLVLAPLFLVTSLCGLALLGRAVLYRQRRVGRSGADFVMLKFRSMGHDRRRDAHPLPHAERRLTHKSSDDPRHTRYGRFIRASSIDELPQFLNVLRGDMSIVGPRPELREVAVKHDLVGHVRHVVRPGLTGMWQISADRPGFVHENVFYDEIYISGVSFVGDLKIIFKTIPVLLRGGGL